MLNLVISTKSLLPHMVTYSQILRIRTWACLQGTYTAYHCLHVGPQRFYTYSINYILSKFNSGMGKDNLIHNERKWREKRRSHQFKWVWNPARQIAHFIAHFQSLGVIFGSRVYSLPSQLSFIRSVAQVVLYICFLPQNFGRLTASF